MSAHVTILTPSSGAVTISPQASCGYLYERFEGDPPALQYNSTSSDPAPADPSWGLLSFTGVILENLNLASNPVVISYDAHFSIKGGTMTLPANSYAHIWALPQNGKLTEISRDTGTFSETMKADWIKKRAAQPFVKTPLVSKSGGVATKGIKP